MDLFLQRLFDGLTNGSAYALIAVALVLIFKATTLVTVSYTHLTLPTNREV